MRNHLFFLHKKWVHSWEDDTEEYRVYRPDHYKFPRSRPRHGIEFKKNGEFIYHKIDRADRPMKIEGYYEIDSDNIIKINFKDEDYEPVSYSLISISNEILKIKR
jgi:hypothetical protein